MQIEVDVRGFRALNIRNQRLVNWKLGLHRPLGRLLKAQHERRIEHDKTAPDGTPWAPLRPYTVAKKQYGGSTNPEEILVDTHHLAGNFKVTTGGDVIRLRNPARYTAFLQDGTRRMVARPFLGISNPNVNEIRRLVENHVRRLLQVP